MNYQLAVKIIKNNKKSQIIIYSRFEITSLESKNYIDSVLCNLPNSLDELTLNNYLLNDTMNFPSGLTKLTILCDRKPKLFDIIKIRTPFGCIVTYNKFKCKIGPFNGYGKQFYSIYWIGS